MNQLIERLAWQIPLFAAVVPKRSELLPLVPTWDCEGINIRVHRNQSFEHIASIMRPYLSYGSYQGSFFYSDYDDSLSWSDLDQTQSTDMEIIWLDFDRYGANFDACQLVSWLKERIQSLRQLTNSPILLSNWISDQQLTDEFNQHLVQLVDTLPGVWIYDRSDIYQRLGVKYFDLRTAKLTGTKLSNLAFILHGRELACRWIPALLKPRIKGIVVDLDNTLYQGVLGEDGVQGVKLTHEHQSLQLELLKLRQTGIFLAIASKNEWVDVEHLFTTRTDFPLQLEHFSNCAVNWEEKSTNIRNIAKKLLISTDSLLFIDDNPGELLETVQTISDLNLICASNAQSTLQTLTWYPRLWNIAISDTDELRVNDLKMTQERQEIVDQSNNVHEYLKGLQVRLTFRIDPLQKLQRLAELSKKTNQFNLNLQRLSEVELELAIQSRHHCVISVELQDRLSDSGVIGLIIGHYKQGWIIEEVCISCRALGRKLEDLIIIKAIQLMQQQQASDEISFCYEYAPRNSPALDWLKRHSGSELDDTRFISLSPISIDLDLNQYPVSMEVSPI